MHSKSRIIILILVVWTYALRAVELTISLPGSYEISDSIVTTPTGTDCIIAINASDVVLDFKNNLIAQGNATANVDGIIISSGVSDVTIQNGIIRNVTGRGVLINPSCARIKLSNVIFENCATRGISGSIINNLEIENCRFFSCCSAATADSALFFDTCSQIQCTNCTISSMTNNTATLSGLSLTTVSLSSFGNLLIQNNVSPIFNGVSAKTGTVNSFVNCVVRNNNASGTVFEGFVFGSSSFDNSFVDCAVLQNSAVTTFTGFDFSGTSTNNVLRNCQVNLNSGASVFGYVLNTSNENILIDCVAQGNTASGAAPNRAVGFLMNNSNFITALRALSGFNRASLGTAIGISLETAGNTNSAFVDCIAEGNQGNTAATSFGFNRAVGANNLFTRSVGYSNNTTVANQLLGIPAGSVSTPAAPASNNIATITGSWTNIAAAA